MADILTTATELATRTDQWQTAPTGTEGTNTVYVNTFTGSDYFGDGTRLKPYQSVGRAFRGGSVVPQRIIVKGVVSENLADGNHQALIMGDSYGSFIFDGGDNFVCYGFSMQNSIILNGGIGREDLVVASGSPLFAGVGRAIYAGYVGDAGGVYGVSAPSNLIHNSALYWSTIGGPKGSCSRNIYSHIKATPYKVALIIPNGWDTALYIANNTIYGSKIDDRRRSPNYGVFGYTIFANFDMYADEGRMQYTKCLFAADCEWYYQDKTLSKQMRIVIDKAATGDVVFTADEETDTMTIGGDGVVDIPSAVDAIFAAGRTSTAVAQKPTFTDCIFSEQTSEQIFNDAEKQDFTLKEGSDAILSDYNYIGALPPALSVPVLHNSNGVPGTWDERTADGIVEVSEDDAIVLNTSFASDAEAPSGSIQSKVVTIDPSKVSLSHVFSIFESKFTSLGLTGWKDEVVTARYYEGETLPVGTYIVDGAVLYNGQAFEYGSIIKVADGAADTFQNNGVESKLLMLADNNIGDALYVRSTPTAFAQITQADELQPMGVYMNNGTSNITYDSRTIVPGESFTANNTALHFEAPSDDYKVDVMFNDTRVPSVEWIPARYWGKYFECYESGVIKKSADTGVPIASGNYEAYFAPYNKATRTILRKRYFQFRIEIRSIYEQVR